MSEPIGEPSFQDRGSTRDTRPADETRLHRDEAIQYAQWKLGQEQRPNEDVGEIGRLVDIIGLDLNTIDRATQRIVELESRLGDYITSYETRSAEGTQETLLSNTIGEDTYERWKNGG